MNILLVGHHPHLTSLVLAALCVHYDVESVRSHKDAIVRLANRWMGALVYVTGNFAPEPVYELRAATDAPLLVVSETEGVDNLVAFLDAGADDYLGKPFSVQELLVRLRSAIRKSGREQVHHFVTEDFSIDLDGHRIFKPDGSEVLLTRTEWTLFETLAARPGQVIDYAELIEAMWGSKPKGGVERLRMSVMAVRRKIEPDPHKPRYVMTMPGRGIFLNLPRPDTDGRE